MPIEPSQTDTLPRDDAAAIDELRAAYERLSGELGRIIVGQKEIIEQLAICLFAGGHALLMGVPGLAKTLLVRRLGETLALTFSRIQFTPDLMPMDITGTDILQEVPGGKRVFEFAKGPLFANIVLADEINRAPSKTQAAMLEAMQEHRVTVIGRTYPLAPPFFVLATQNPIEQEGTYPLPEAQLDRFMFLIQIDYPSRDEEIEIARTTTGAASPLLNETMGGDQVVAYQELVRRVPVPEHLYAFATDLARQTRPHNGESPAWLKPLVAWGAGPRAVQYLVLGAKARAALHGSYLVRWEDVIAVAEPVLTHRVITTFTAESDGITSRDVVRRLVDELGRDRRVRL
ncbi:MAG: AAA family ATPase [Planctomycetes bacterium]|nr:AAA family ATPase [Planctomycetota bacterium]